MKQNKAQTAVQEQQPFDVRLSGRVLEGFEAASVQARLAALFQRPVAEIETFFPGKPCLLKSAIDGALAQRYGETLRAAGAEVIIEPHTPGGPDDAKLAEAKVQHDAVAPAPPPDEPTLAAQPVSEKLDHFDLGGGEAMMVPEQASNEAPGAGEASGVPAETAPAATSAEAPAPDPVGPEPDVSPAGENSSSGAMPAPQSAAPGPAPRAEADANEPPLSHESNAATLAPAPRAVEQAPAEPADEPPADTATDGGHPASDQSPEAARIPPARGPYSEIEPAPQQGELQSELDTQTSGLAPATGDEGSTLQPADGAAVDAESTSQPATDSTPAPAAAAPVAEESPLSLSSDPAASEDVAPTSQPADASAPAPPRQEAPQSNTPLETEAEPVATGTADAGDASAPSPAQSAGATSSAGEDLLTGFVGELPRIKVSRGYKIGITAVAVAMVLLPLAYLYLIGLVAWGLMYHASENVDLFFGDVSRYVAVFVYFIPLMVGPVLLIFMFKPILAPWRRRGDLVNLDPQRYARMYAFVHRICETVGAPRPAQIKVDCEVNASARFHHGWRSFFTNELVVTIGLPLLAGLNTRQVAGILAHEFGHFTQGAGMRMNYLIRMINRWLYHGAYERDLLDEKLTQWSNSNQSWLYLASRIARLFIWAIRQLMKGFMHIGLAISAMMSREMEFDADRYEAGLSGSEQFRDTTVQLRRLHIAAHQVYNELQEAWYQHQMLVDDLAAAIAANYARQPETVSEEIDKFIAEAQSHLFDSHPTDRERIARAEREATEGIFQLSVPATELIAKFEKLSKEVTFLYYRNQLDIPVTKPQLLPLPVFEAKTQARQENETAAEAYFGDSYNPFVSFECQVDYNSSARDPHGLLGEWRNAVQLQRQRYLQAREHQDAFHKANKRVRELLKARVLLNAGVRINARDYALTNSLPETIERALNKAQSERQRWLDASKDYVSLVQRRMQMAYALIQSPEYAEQRAPLQSTLGELIAVSQTLPRLNRVLQELLSLNDRTPQLYILLRHYKSEESESEVITSIKRLAAECDRQLQAMRRQLQGVTYPFEHTNPDLQLHDYIFQSYRNNMTPAAVYHCCEDVIATVSSLQQRCVGQLANTALRIETALGLIRSEQNKSA